MKKIEKTIDISLQEGYPILLFGSLSSKKEAFLKNVCKDKNIMTRDYSFYDVNMFETYMTFRNGMNFVRMAPLGFPSEAEIPNNAKAFIMVFNLEMIGKDLREPFIELVTKRQHKNYRMPERFIPVLLMHTSRIVAMSFCEPRS